MDLNYFKYENNLQVYYGILIHDYEPLDTFTGKCLAIIHRTNDSDDKLVVVPDSQTFTDEEIKVLTDFQEQYFKSIIFRPDDYIS